MKLKIDPNLNFLDIYAVGTEVPQLGVGLKQKELKIHRFEAPVLLTDNARISKLPSLKRDAVLKLNEFPDRVVEYDGVSVHWSPVHYPGVWCPSIDTILFAKGIREALVKTRILKKINNFLEIGTGSGFLSKYLLIKKKDLGEGTQSARLTDINRDALRCAKDNIANIKGKTKVFYTLAKNAGKLEIPGKYDLVITNPPYIPRSNARKNNPYEGLMLYRELVLKIRKILKPDGVFMTNFSSLSRSIVRPELDKIFNLKTVAKMRIPLKIPVVTAGFSPESRKWINYLKKKRFLEEDKGEKSGYRYWHTIEIVVGNLR